MGEELVASRTYKETKRLVMCEFCLERSLSFIQREWHTTLHLRDGLGCTIIAGAHMIWRAMPFASRHRLIGTGSSRAMPLVLFRSALPRGPAIAGCCFSHCSLPDRPAKTPEHRCPVV